ncbi:MAG: hypothetical protein BA863_04200 [Desulfovibrio sp. S3730MH75]|nr:MAG: hypothetical protein BA863_04200 [Desulfovibrio sp. S3730MH75]
MVRKRQETPAKKTSPSLEEGPAIESTEVPLTEEVEVEPAISPMEEIPLSLEEAPTLEPEMEVPLTELVELPSVEEVAVPMVEISLLPPGGVLEVPEVDEESPIALEAIKERVNQ